MNKKIDCNIIVDLLPLYHDNVVSEETKNAISEHLQTCENCKREYQLISEELPKVSPNSTKDKFSQMVKKQKLKRIFSIFLAVILGCGVTMGGIYVLREVPLKTITTEDIKIIRTYVAETEQGAEVFVWYSSPFYYGIKYADGEIDATDDILQYDIIEKVPLLSTPQEDIEFERVASFNLENQYGDVEEITFNDEIIWSATKNADDEIPPYVHEYLKNNYESRTVTYDYKQGFIGIDYDNTDGGYWDLDGNIIDKETIDFD